MPGELREELKIVAEGRRNDKRELLFRLQGQGKREVRVGYLRQSPVWKTTYRLIMDKEGAAAARKKILGMIAADRIPFVGYHMPYPAVGYAEVLGEGFRYVPASYQLNL